MRHLGHILVILFFSACNSFDTRVLDAPKYSSGIEYISKQKIKPKTFQFDNYTFVSGNSGQASTLGLYFKDKELFYTTSADGFFDTVMTANLNSDGIPDFLFVDMFEDGKVLYSLISKTKTTYDKRKVTDDYGGSFCFAGADTMKYLQPTILKDINNDGKAEILINHIKMGDKIFRVSCSDTFFVDR